MVMTPSSPTLLMASEISAPTALSLAEMAATWAIFSFSLTGMDFFFSSSTTKSMAFSIPWRICMPLAPAATFFIPSRMMAREKIVAVVVPSPAMSLVLDATSLRSWAPAFSNGSSSSISLAMVTPSLVMVGEPNFFSSTTLRPLGPSVTPTVSATLSMPRSIARRASSPKERILAIIGVPPVRNLWCYFSTIARTSRSLKMTYSSPSIFTSVPAYLLKMMRSPTFTSTGSF